MPRSGYLAFRLRCRTNSHRSAFFGSIGRENEAVLAEGNMVESASPIIGRAIDCWFHIGLPIFRWSAEGQCPRRRPPGPSSVSSPIFSRAKNRSFGRGCRRGHQQWGLSRRRFPRFFMMLAIAWERFFSWNSLKCFPLKKLHIHFSGEPIHGYRFRFFLDDSRFFTSLGEKKTATDI